MQPYPFSAPLTEPAQAYDLALLRMDSSFLLDFDRVDTIDLVREDTQPFPSIYWLQV